MLLTFVGAVSWLAAVVGLLARSPEAANGSTVFFTLLPYASSAFVPIHTMPHWLQGFAQDQPITPLTETLRGLLLEHRLDPNHGSASRGAPGSSRSR